MRNLYKTIPLTVDGQSRDFRLKKLDAFSGAFLLRMLLKHVPEGDASRISTQSLVNLIFTELSEEELRALMTTCLNHTEVLLEAGYQPVMMKNEWGYPELEYGTGTCLRLTIESALWTFSGFFAESGSASRPAASPA